MKNSPEDAQKAVQAMIELIAAKAVTRSLKAGTGLKGAMKNFNSQMNKKGINMPDFILENLVKDAYERGQQQARDRAAQRRPAQLDGGGTDANGAG